MKIEIKHCITGAVLFSLECGNLKDCVVEAVGKKADLSGAYLRCAYLRCAYLSGADQVIDLGQPNGWNAFAWLKKNTVMVQVGCKSFTLAEGRAYWAGKDNRREVLAALDYAEAVANLRGWVK